MMRKILKVFFWYSYLSLVFYVASDNLLTIGRYEKMAKTTGEKVNLKIGWLWTDTLKNFKKWWTIMDS